METKLILEIINNKFPELIVNFDLDDCDKILRVEGEKINIGKLKSIINTENFNCEIL